MGFEMSTHECHGLGLSYTYGFGRNEGYSYNYITNEATPTASKSKARYFGIGLSANYAIPMGEKLAFLTGLFVGYGGSLGTSEPLHSFKAKKNEKKDRK